MYLPPAIRLIPFRTFTISITQTAALLHASKFIARKMLSDINNGLLRLALRIYFIGTMTLLGIIGRQCCKYSAKLDLIKGKSVNLHRMTGWLQLRDIVICLWKLRRLPGGWWLGLMMIVGSVLTLAADLTVARLVYPGYVRGLCLFKRGLVMDWTDEAGYNSPPSNGYPALIASNAQYLSVDNGCDYGIYKKVPNYSGTTICAGVDDIMGSWVCNDLQQDLDFDEDVSADSIGSSLYENDLQYDNKWSTSIVNGYEETTHLIIWSSSADDDAGTPFDVKISIDMNGNITAEKTMKSFQCSISSTSYLSPLNRVLSSMESNTTLGLWVDGLEQVLYRGDFTNASPNISQGLEQYLNTMTMVQGGNNYVFNETLPGDLPFYGCLVLKTNISLGVLALVGFAGLILIVTLIYYFSLILRLGRHALPSFLSRSGAGQKNPKPIPDSVLSWMLQASRENALATQSGDHDEATCLLGVPGKEGELRNWNFNLVDAGNGIARMVRTRGHVAPNVEQVQFTTMEK